ncbi:hypothetical protein [Pseudoalteromonas sp. NC201]|uniref:hypothetical protein n=1 Tax=Pseudoalteromonas sp. NC201 TaxID=1514074 RepID=UPI000C7BAFE2|nr:hypothetical protein [Pseudoalteromonas sp. NC201]AUJ69004.1 hypothetical protein PNC201_03345 [Pseudoalteromonas sp. NC201]
MKKVKLLDLISRIYFFLFRVGVNTAEFKKLATASVVTNQNLLHSESIQSVVGGNSAVKPRRKNTVDSSNAEIIPIDSFIG